MSLPVDLRIARHGIIVLLLGMLTGFMMGRFHSRTLANAAHLTGLIGGYGLISLGLLWPKLKLSPAVSSAGALITILSMYLNWAGLVLQDFLGSTLGPNRSGYSMQAGPVVLALAVVLSLISVAVVLTGLRQVERNLSSIGPQTTQTEMQDPS